MRAAAFLFALAFGVGACSDREEMPLPPWHMWGNSQVTTLTKQPVGGSNFSLIESQLVRINYGRPETWNFLFSMLVTGDDLTAVSGSPNLQVHFDMTVGIGRTSVTLKDFAQFNVDGAAGNGPPAGLQRFCTQVQIPKINSTDTVDNVVRDFVAQDIQLQTRVILSNVDGGNQLTVQTDAYFAPVTHIRPEWYKIDEGGTAQFPGGEDAGK